MRKIVFHSLIVIFFIILLNQLAIYSGKIYKDGASIVCEQKREAVRKNKWQPPHNKATVLYFGASDILSAIIPEVFDSILDNKTYSINLALPALPIGPYYFTLLDYIKNNPPPDYIIMSYHVETEPILLFDSYANQGIDFPNEVFSYFLYSKNKNQTVNYLLPCHVYREPVFKFLYHLFHDRSEIKKKKEINKDIIDQMIANRGYYFIKEQSKFPDGTLPENYSEKSDCPDCTMKVYDPDGDYYAEKFFTLTHDYHIKVFLINYPVRKGKFKQYEKIPHVIKKITSRYPNVTYPSEGWKIPFYSNQYFSDPHHLNKKGAILFTEKIADEFKYTYNLNNLLYTEKSDYVKH